MPHIPSTRVLMRLCFWSALMRGSDAAAAIQIPAALRAPLIVPIFGQTLHISIGLAKSSIHPIYSITFLLHAGTLLPRSSASCICEATCTLVS